MPVVWLCGPPGVGKTSVAWQLYRRAVADGRRTAYVDVDQLGICYPEPADDPGRHPLEARNVDALRRTFAAAGAECLIVSGVVDAVTGPTIAGVTTIRLRADPAELLGRLASRRGSSADAEAVLAEAAALDHSTFPASVIDTTGLAIDDIAARVPAWPTGEARPDRNIRSASAAGHLLWLHGPPGVGKSTIGFRAYLDTVRTGRVTAFVDIDQLGFFDPPTGTRPDLQASNLAATWDEFANAGAELAVVVGPLSTGADAHTYAQALPNVTFTWCALHADEPELTRRILSRADGGSWPQPGDPLRNQPTAALLATATHAATLKTTAPGPRLDVTALSVPQAAHAVLATTTWPP